jgi:hypothetical protein
MSVINLALLALERIDELGETVRNHHDECFDNHKNIRNHHDEVKNSLRKQEEWTHAIKNAIITDCYEL